METESGAVSEEDESDSEGADDESRKSGAGDAFHLRGPQGKGVRELHKLLHDFGDGSTVGVEISTKTRHRGPPTAGPSSEPQAPAPQARAPHSTVEAPPPHTRRPLPGPQRCCVARAG